MILLAYVLMGIGVVFQILGVLSLYRFPDVYTRTHAQTVCNVGGSCLVLFGVFIEKFYSVFSIKALFIIFFIFLTSPVSAHAITRAAYKSGTPAKKLTRNDLKVIKNRKK